MKKKMLRSLKWTNIIIIGPTGPIGLVCPNKQFVKY